MGFWDFDGFWGSQRWKIMVFVVRYHVVTSLPESSEAEQQLLLQICQQLVFGMLQVGVAAGSGSYGEKQMEHVWLVGGFKHGFYVP